MNGRKRPDWAEYALLLAKTASLRSEDPWRQVGAAALRWDNSTAATGYNGVPPGVTIDWSDREERQKYIIHAEKNCLNYVKPGECSLLACTHMPCADCLREITLKRIPVIIYAEEYKRNGVVSVDAEINELIRVFGIQLIHLPIYSSIEKSS